jgi:N-acyl homoserine lactone hydrolase
MVVEHRPVQYCPPRWTPDFSIIVTLRGANTYTEDSMDTEVRSLTVLDFGRANIDMGTVMAPGDLDGSWEVCAFPAYLVELADGRHVLIDTGPNRRHIHEPMFEFAGTDFGKHLIPQMTDADDPINRIAEVGLTPDDIDILILTHTHFDHAGNTADFHKSEIYIHEDAWQTGIERGKQGVPGGIPETNVDGKPINYHHVTGDTQVVPGLELMETPGHAPGHLSVLLRLPETGTIILAIDAIYSQANRDFDNYKIGHDPDTGAQSAHRLIAVAEREHAMLIYGHDPVQWKQLRKAPERYG